MGVQMWISHSTRPYHLHLHSKTWSLGHHISIGSPWFSNWKRPAWDKTWWHFASMYMSSTFYDNVVGWCSYHSIIQFTMLNRSNWFNFNNQHMKIHENIKTQLFSQKMKRKYTNKICVCNAFSINKNYFKDPSFHVCMEACDIRRQSIRFHEKEFMMLYFEKKIDGGSFISSFTTLITSLDGCFGCHTLKKNIP